MSGSRWDRYQYSTALPSFTRSGGQTMCTTPSPVAAVSTPHDTTFPTPSSWLAGIDGCTRLRRLTDILKVHRGSLVQNLKASNHEDQRPSAHGR